MKLTSILINIPFTYMWILKRIARNPKTVLDLGCGDGEIMKIIGSKKWKTTGIDIYSSSLKQAKATGMYKELIKGDLVTVAKRLVKQKKKYDLVFCSQVIEHITRKDGIEIFLKGNPHQHHKSGWIAKDFEKKGYTVRGVGFKPLWSESGVARIPNKSVEFVLSAIAFFLNPIIYIFPSLGAGILAIKDIKNEKK